MLVLTLKLESGIILYTTDGEVHIKVLEIDNRVKLGIDAPEKILVLRTELIDGKI